MLQLVVIFLNKYSNASYRSKFIKLNVRSSRFKLHISHVYYNYNHHSEKSCAFALKRMRFVFNNKCDS